MNRIADIEKELANARQKIAEFTTTVMEKNVKI